MGLKECVKDQASFGDWYPGDQDMAEQVGNGPFKWLVYRWQRGRKKPLGTSSTGIGHCAVSSQGHVPDPANVLPADW